MQFCIFYISISIKTSGGTNGNSIFKQIFIIDLYTSSLSSVGITTYTVCILKENYHGRST